MAYFRYCGDPAHGGEGPAMVEAFGHRFMRDAPTEVTDKKAAAKLARNSHFEEVDADAAAKMTKAAADAAAKSAQEAKKAAGGNQG